MTPTEAKLIEIRARIEAIESERERLRSEKTRLLIPECRAAEGKCFVRRPNAWEVQSDGLIFVKIIRVAVFDDGEDVRMTFLCAEVNTSSYMIKREWFSEDLLSDPYRKECPAAEYDAARTAVLHELDTADIQMAKLKPSPKKEEKNA